MLLAIFFVLLASMSSTIGACTEFSRSDNRWRCCMNHWSHKYWWLLVFKTLQGKSQIKIISIEIGVDMHPSDIILIDIIESQIYASDGISREWYSTLTVLNKDYISDLTLWCENSYVTSDFANKTTKQYTWFPALWSTWKQRIPLYMPIRRGIKWVTFSRFVP